MATLQHEAWKVEGDTLFMTGKSIGNGQMLTFTDTLMITHLTSDTLILQKKQLSRTFTKHQLQE